MKIRNCGRDRSCELVLEHPTVSRFHARVELADDGRISLQDSESRNGTFLNRNDTWIRVSRVVLCIGDRIRFGDNEVSLAQLTALFGRRPNIRLGALPLPKRDGRVVASLRADMQDPGDLLHKPRRNPVTGKIEEEHHG